MNVYVYNKCICDVVIIGVLVYIEFFIVNV